MFGLLLVFTVVPLSLAGTAFFAVSRDAAVTVARQQSSGYSALVANSLRFLLEDVAEISLDFVRSESLRDTLISARGIQPAGAPPAVQSELIDEVSYVVASNRQIRAVTVFDNDGDHLSTDRYRDYRPALAAAVQRSGAGAWYLIPTPDRTATHTLSYIRLVRDYRDIRRHIGFVAIDLDERELQIILQNGAPFSSTRSYVIDAAGVIVASGDQGAVGIHWDEVLRDRDDIVEHRAISGEVPFSVVQVSNRNEVLGPVKTMVRFFGTVLAGLTAICVLFASWVSQRVVAPIAQLTRLLRQVEENNYRISAPVNGDDEIAELARQFNAMVSRIRTLFHEVYVAQIHERDAELRALQSQINPHFLHNTLNALYLNARFEQAPQTAALIKEFSSLMRYAMQTDRPIVSLKEEIEHANSYLALQQHRIGERLAYRFQIDDAPPDRHVLRLILQPIVENAIVHGIEASASQLEIEVRVSTEGDAVIYHVTDNGPGFDASIVTSNGIGLSNVRERLTWYFDDPDCLTVVALDRGGTRVSVRQPAQVVAPHA